MKFKILIVTLILTFSAKSFAIGHEILRLATKTMTIAKTSNNALDILKAGEIWRKSFIENDIYLRTVNGEPEDVLTKKTKELIVDQIEDQLKDLLPNILVNSIDLLTNNLTYKIVSRVFSPEEIAGPVKELELLNQQVNNEILSGLERLYPKEMNSILYKIEHVSQ